MDGNGKTNLLIVDDESTIREVLKRTFEERGFVCSTATNYDEALEKLEGDCFDAAMLDIMMPGRSGVELLGAIMEHDRDVAVVMVTAVADAQTAINAMRLGAYDYVTKPFNLVEVVMSMERALEKRQLLVENRNYQQRLEETVKERTDELRETFVGAMSSLAEALDAKDPYTNGHSKRVTEISVVLATELGLDESQIEKIRMAGDLHDIGKIGIPEAILNKRGKLSDEEFECVKSHSERGEKIIEPFIRDATVRAIIRHHHERFSGGGYPDGKAGEDIPLGSRIMAVADAYDAMTSDRSYRKAMSPDNAKAQLMANRGSQFDPEIVDIFIMVENKIPFCPVSARPKSKT
ncbi:MAG: response regulator [Gaiellales bacterium]|nr:MAG: response regulator [Gaiellales bacterium]